MRVYAFTGTSHGITALQAGSIRQVFDVLLPSLVQNGCCIGADQAMAHVCRIRDITLAFHPSTPEQAAWAKAFRRVDEQVYSTRGPLTRNRIMVKLGVRGLIATPGQATEILRSGTWATVREARKLKRPIWIISPDGTIHVE